MNKINDSSTPLGFGYGVSADGLASPDGMRVTFTHDSLKGVEGDGAIVTDRISMAQEVHGKAAEHILKLSMVQTETIADSVLGLRGGIALIFAKMSNGLASIIGPEALRDGIVRAVAYYYGRMQWRRIVTGETAQFDPEVVRETVLEIVDSGIKRDGKGLEQTLDAYQRGLDK